MEIINTLVGVPLGYIMYFCYSVTQNYGLAIVFFTLITKIILFPLSLGIQKNSIKMVKMKPKIDEIKKRHAGDKDRIADEQIKLYSEEKYSPALGLVPTLVQIPFILGLIYVIYNPIQHLLHIDKESIFLLQQQVCEILGVQSLTVAPELKIIEMLQTAGMSVDFEVLRNQILDFDLVVSSIQGFDLSFLGMNLSEVPSISSPSVLLIVPVLSGISCLLMCVVQNKINVLQKEQGFWGKWGMTAFLVAFSTYFPFVFPAGVGIYWIFTSLFSLPVMALVNVVHNPKKHIDYASRPVSVKLTVEEKKAQRCKVVENRQRSSRDKKRFFSDENNNKQLVFYSAKNGFYKYFENIIAFILTHSDIVIHYVTSDPDDSIFQKNESQIIPYYINEKMLIPFMMQLDVDMVVMTMPDLQKFHIKRSLVKKDIEYIYTFHGMASTHMVLREGALDHYDTIFCVGQHQIEEIRATEKAYKLPVKNLLPMGYGLIDNLIASYEALGKEKNIQKKMILIAPSWQEDNILESCLDELLLNLFHDDYSVILRPHPEFIKRFPLKMQSILEKYRSRVSDSFIIETDFSSSTSLFTADLIVTDWSGIAYEFSYATKKPSLFINTPMKIMNPEYEKISCVPLDISLRNEVGISVDMDKLNLISSIVSELFSQQALFSDKIQQTMDKYVFNLGRSGEIGGQYIIDTLKQKKESDE